MQLRLIAATLLLTLGSSSWLTYIKEPLLAQAPTPTNEERIIEAVTLNSRGAELVYKDLVGLADLQAGLELFQQALAIFRKYQAQTGEGNSLVNIGYVHMRKGENSQALEFFQQSLAIWKATRDRQNEWISLSYIGEVYMNLGQYQKALDFYHPSLAILREIKAANPKDFGFSYSEEDLLTHIGAVYFRLGKYEKAQEFYQQNLALRQADKDDIGSVETLNNLGVIAVNLGKYAQALDIYHKGLTTVQNFCYQEKLTCFYGLEAALLNNLAGAYFNLGQYQKSLEFAEKSATIYKKFRDSDYKGTSKKEIELLYNALGQNSQGLQQITRRANVGDAYGKDSFQFQGEALNLNNIGEINLILGKYEQALSLYEQALNIYQENKYKQGIAVTLNNIGRVYTKMRKYEQAIQSNQQALVINREIGDRSGEGVTISNLGQIYQQQNQYEKSLELYQQALAIHREVNDKVNEAEALKYLAEVLGQQNQPQLAIAFYKESVNLTETMRQNLRVVATDIQQSYTETVAERYRRLADLLLKQNRSAEAQQVLDLLKIQEVNDFIGQRRGSADKVETPPKVIANQQPQSPEKLPLKPQEQEISQKYSNLQDKAIALGQELTKLRKINPTERTPAQEKRIAELVKLEQDLTTDFNKFIKSPAVVALVQQLSITSQQENLSLRQLNSIRENLRQLNQKAVLLYPLVLDDRLELVIVTADTPPIHRTVPVKQAELNQVILEYRQTIQVPYKNIKKPAQQLYNWLIKPIENDLKQADAKTIIYAPDGQLRYIPLAALYDGKNWLVERFIINNITAASLTKFDTKKTKNFRVLAAAFTKGNYTLKFANRQEIFSGLAFAKQEVENIGKMIPGTRILLDNDFSPSVVIPQMNDYKIIHLATHGLLVKGTPEDSFILFGDGKRANLKDIENWSLPNVDLVVLSACQTGLGDKLGNGQEILGLGYQIQLTGAKASIASLWSVSDGGTQALMNVFYQTLQAGNTTKAEALRTAQIALLTGKYSGIYLSPFTAANNKVNHILTAEGGNKFSHPYYWAPFILIGNGL